MDKQLLENTVEEALDAFWATVAHRFPQAITGDISPETTFTLLFAAERAVKEWVKNMSSKTAQVPEKIAGTVRGC